MDFSDAMVGGKSTLSPDNTMIAALDKTNIVVRDAESLEVLSIYPTIDVVNQLVWSPDSSFIACVLAKRSTLQVFSLHDPTWHCKIDTGAQGLVSALWCPDSRHVITFTDCNLRMYVWSLLRKTVACVKYPKFTDERACAFTTDGQYMITLTRYAGTDTLSVFALASWSLSHSISLPTADAQLLSLSHAAGYIAIADTPMEYNVYVYDMSLSLLKHYSAYTGQLGIRCLSVSPTDAFLAIGSFDGRVRALNSITWDPTFEAHCSSSLASSPLLTAAVLYQEQFVDSQRTAFKVVTPPLSLPAPSPDSTRTEPLTAVRTIAWSTQERYMASVSDATPCSVWIHDVHNALLASVCTVMHSITAIAWDPVRLRLVICTGQDRVYLWSPEGCSVINVPLTGFRATMVQWTASGDALLLSNEVAHCMCFVK